MDELLSRELHEWIDASLVPKGLLSTATPLKQVAMPADLTLLRNTLFKQIIYPHLQIAGHLYNSDYSFPWL
jgi:hypothetical protein